jgi:2-polyprenyl-3-methyl-5-hydroxy-6-metoxy-1,4-benzoquinol methylase
MGRSRLALASGKRCAPVTLAQDLTSQMSSNVDPHYFTETALREWTKIGARHRLRDEYFLQAVEAFFRLGSILELGAATGHLSEILHRRGFDVTASDVSPRFVAAIKSRGLQAALVDATADIHQQTGRVFANVLAQNVLPLIRHDRAMVCSALAAIHAGLEPRGRLICISAHAWRDRDPEFYFTPREQIAITKATDLFRIISIFPHQVVPTKFYRNWNGRLLNFLDFHAAKLAAVRLVWIAERIG